MQKSEKVEDDLRLLESLLVVSQESAEHGDMPHDVYADMFELSRNLVMRISTKLIVE